MRKASSRKRGDGGLGSDVASNDIQSVHVFLLNLIHDRDQMEVCIQYDSTNKGPL